GLLASSPRPESLLPATADLTRPTLRRQSRPRANSSSGHIPLEIRARVRIVYAARRDTMPRIGSAGSVQTGSVRVPGSIQRGLVGAIPRVEAHPRPHPGRPPRQLAAARGDLLPAARLGACRIPSGGASAAYAIIVEQVERSQAAQAATAKMARE